MYYPRSNYAALETLVGKMARPYIADDQFRLDGGVPSGMNYVTICQEMSGSFLALGACGTNGEPQSVVPVNILGVF